MTEEEAKTKYCPMGGRSVSIKSSGDFKIGEFTLCIASDCMMWRAYEIQYADDMKTSIQREGGYCGLTYGN